MNTKLKQRQLELKCLDTRFSQNLVLTKKKNLIGSSETCDIKLMDHSVSSYHAFLVLKGDEGLMVKDLYSEGGVFVNGNRVEESYVGPGDVLTVGTLSFSLEVMDNVAQVVDLDQDKAPIAISMPVLELPSKEGLVFIDGEYCDIKFNDVAFKPLHEQPAFAFKGDFVDLESDNNTPEITFKTQKSRLEVMSYMNGLMLDISYLDLSKGDYQLSSIKKSKRDILFHTIAKTKLFSFEDGKIKFYPNDEITPSIAWDKIDLSEAVFFTKGSEQISLRLVDQSFGHKALPLFYRDREFLKQSSKVFASVFLPFLILLFVAVPKPEEIKEEIAVIYKLPDVVKKAAEAQEKSELKAEELTSKTENTGHKQTEQPPQKVEFAQASQNKKVEAKAAAPKAASAQPAATTPVKSYSFKSSVALNSLAGEAPTINTEGSTSKSAVDNTTFNSGSSDSGELVAGANVGVSKFNGSDAKGSGSASYGSRGLASKSGFDSSYLEPKTVVLGSMDPELLRKILREYIPQFRHCYQQELIGNSEKIKGVIDLNFTISAGGKVSKYAIKIKDAQFSSKGVGCMGQVLSLIDFPKPKGGGVVDVRQPLNFFAETEKI